MLVREITKQDANSFIPVCTTIYKVTSQEVDFISLPIKPGLSHVTCFG